MIKERKEKMNLKNIWLLLMAIAMAMALVFLSGCIQQEEGIKIIEEGKIEKEAGIVGYGYSVSDSAKEAVQEAVFLAKKELSEAAPEYVLLFSTVDYDVEEVVREVKRLLPSAQIYGGTSMLAVMTKDGFHTEDGRALALMAVSSPKITFGVGGADINEFPSAREAGRAAISEAIKNAGKEGSPQLILITGSVGNEEELLLGIEDVVGKDVPAIGGSSADNDLTGKWKQFANDKVYSNGVALTAIYTDLKVGWAYEAGYLRSENKGTITRSEGRIIYEIDNRPAAEVYNEWTNGAINEELKVGGTILSKTTFYPLAKVITMGAEIYYLSIHPLSVNLPEKSLTVFTNIKQGDELLLMHGGWELLLNRAQTTPRKALISKGISKEEILFGIYTYCAGTMLAIPEKERAKMPLLINNELGGAPFIGTFTFGEQGPLGEENHHGNLVNSMIVFAD